MKIKIITVIPVILIMCVIFYFSAQPGEASDESSITIVEHVLNIYQQIGTTPTTIDSHEYTILKDTLNLIVRKSAHIMIFATLCFSLCFHVLAHHIDKYYTNESIKYKGESPLHSEISPIKILLISIVITVLYACSDELHQRFTPGRSGNVIDIGIDSIGILFGAIMFLLLYKLILRFIIFIANSF